MNWHNALDLNPFDKLWEVLFEWGEEIESLPMEEVDNILAENGVNTEPLVRSIKSRLKAKDIEEQKSSEKTEKDCNKTGSKERAQPLWEEAGTPIWDEQKTPMC
jgi:hypothetical protein